MPKNEATRTITYRHYPGEHAHKRSPLLRPLMRRRDGAVGRVPVWNLLGTTRTYCDHTSILMPCGIHRMLRAREKRPVGFPWVSFQRANVWVDSNSRRCTYRAP